MTESSAKSCGAPPPSRRNAGLRPAATGRCSTRTPAPGRPCSTSTCICSAAAASPGRRVRTQDEGRGTPDEGPGTRDEGLGTDIGQQVVYPAVFGREKEIEGAVAAAEVRLR